MSRTVFALVVLAALPAWASNPGEPLEWEDWVVAAPELTAQPWLARLPQQQCDVQDPPDIRCDPVHGVRADADGNIYFPVERIENNVCLSGSNRRTTEIWAQHRNGTATLIASLSDRCGPNPDDHFDVHAFQSLSVDREAGVLLLMWVTWDQRTDDTYGQGSEAMKITGLTTLFDVLQSFAPTANSVSFRVPYMPEGMPAADWFDTYYGDLATVGDWSQAQGLQCSYPTAAPSVGDYLTVADMLPDPAPGEGRYYFTSATYQGETRYGRRTVGGVKSGRDPAVLPICSE